MIQKPKKQLIRFVNQLHERREAFKSALDWVGIFVTKEELMAWIGDRNKEFFNDRKLWRDQNLDGPRRNMLVEKI